MAVERTRWCRSLILSCTIHCLLLLAVAGIIGFMPPAAPEEYWEVELATEAAADAAPPVAQAAAAMPRQDNVPAYQPVQASVDIPAGAVGDGNVGGSPPAAPGFRQVMGAGGAAVAPKSTGRILPPRILSNVAPHYPESARQSGWQGTVGVKAEILTDGLVGKVWVAKSSGYDALDQAAVEAVRQFRFVPARDEESGSPVVCVTSIPVVFQLR